MASKVGGSVNPVGKKGPSSASSISSRLKETWLMKNWQTALVLILVILLAFFVRAYFAYPDSVDNGFLVSGGSDSYYHKQVIGHVTTTGQHLVTDPTMNYPLGIRNERPPMYDWTVAVSGLTLGGLGFTLDDGVGFSLVLSTALWGALTIIPVYLMANAVFGRKAGIIAGMLFAFMPGHIERSVLSNADHDAMVLFFVVFAFYFFMRSLQTTKGTKWISSWKQPKQIQSGLMSYVRMNQVPLIYSALAGVCVAAVAMIWTGYVYILIIILVFYVVQLLIDRFRNADSFGMVANTFVMWAVAFLVMLPVYYLMNYWDTWYDMPLTLFLIGTVVGLIFAATRDYPWVIVLPTVAALAIVSLLALSVVAPNILNAVLSGQGYLVKSKLYSTISEAQSPVFSTLVMSFGALSFWLALIGVGYAAIKIPKNSNPYFVFMVVFGAVSIYMASSAGRFLFNAAPAFAILGGWMLAKLIDWIKFDEYFRALAPTLRNPKMFIRKLLSLRVVTVTILLAVLLVLPNVWTAVDAGIPSENKKEYDLEIYKALPSFLHPSSYDSTNGSYWYLGAFAYSLPLPSGYWPAAWSWYSMQDLNETKVDRPAFLSWWDYGFEASEEGAHPTVADNFQNGYQFAGTFICSQNETQAIALFLVRLLEMGLVENSDVWLALEQSGVNVTELSNIMKNPASYIPYVLAHPDIFGPYDTDLSASNAKYAMASYELGKVGLSNIVGAYHNVRELTGYDIGYFAIDSRLFPFSATSQNIFYAPVKLSDRRIDAASNSPIDYYVIKAVDQYGNEYDIGSVPATAVIVDYSITYTDMFYNSMLYKAFLGFGPKDVGKTTQGLPGLSGSLASLPSMQAWNMTHFRMVYRTAYYNPYPSTDVQNHSADWIAISYEDGLEFQKLISAGKLNATVDLSSSVLQQGVVFIQYYDGAIIKGNAVAENGDPMEGIWVTVQDEFGIPHNTVKTDANGYFEVIAPFGNVSVVYSYGTLDLRTQVAKEITRKNYTISYDQAMRRTAAINALAPAAESTSDWIINGSLVLSSASVYGKVYYDTNSKQSMENATVTITDGSTGYSRQTTAYEGNYYFTGLPPMVKATVKVVYNGHVVNEKATTLEPKVNKSVDIATKPATITETITLPQGAAASGVSVDLNDLMNGTVITRSTNAKGVVVFDMLLPGNYSVTANDSSFTLGPRQYTLVAGAAVSESIVLYDAMSVSGLITSGTDPVPYARIGFTSATSTTWVLAGADGKYQAILPLLNYTAYAVAVLSGQEKVALVTMASASTVVLNMNMIDASVLEGFVLDGSAVVASSSMVVTSSSGAALTGSSNSLGSFRFALPAGQYVVYAAKGNMTFWGEMSTGNANISLTTGATLEGKVWTDIYFNGQMSNNPGWANFTVMVTQSNGWKLQLATDKSGKYNVALPAGLAMTIDAVVRYYDPVSISYTTTTENAVKDIQLVSSLRDVSGSVKIGATAQVGAVVQFIANGKGAINGTATTDASGNYFVKLRPGNYKVMVDQNVTDNDSYRLQLLQTGYLNLTIGQAPTVKDLDAVVRFKLSGTIGPGEGTIKFSWTGLDNIEATVNATYSVYVRPGNYSVYVNLLSDRTRYAYLDRMNVTGPTTADINITTPAELVNLRAEYDSRGVSTPVRISNSSTGAYVDLKTSVSGSTSIYMPSGNYTVMVDHHTMEVLPISPSAKYVLYSGSTTFLLVSSSMSVDLALNRTLDNATVTGLPIGVGFQFNAISGSAISTNFTSTGADIYLAPGNYSVYGVGVGQVFFDDVTIAPYVINVPGITMVAGIHVTGTTLLNGAGKQANLTIEQGQLFFEAQSAADGAYDVYLPGGAYIITASTSLNENGIGVDYTGSVSISTVSSMVQDITMNKVVKASVSLTWDRSQIKTIETGQPATYTVTVKNLGNVLDSYNITYSGTGWNVTVTPTRVENLTYGAGGSVELSVTIIPSDKIYVDHAQRVTLRITSTTGTGATASVSLDANIVPHFGVNLTYAQAQTQDSSNHVYWLNLQNSGNNVTSIIMVLTNVEELRENGWNVSMSIGDTGVWNDTLIVSKLTAGKAQLIKVSLIANRADPNPDVMVNIFLRSIDQPDVVGQLSFRAEFPILTVPALTVTGNAVSLSLPEIPVETYVVLVLVIMLAALVIYYSFLRGVLARKK